MASENSREGWMVVGITPETAGTVCALCYPLPQSEEEARRHHQGPGTASLAPGSGYALRRVRIVGKGQARRFEVVPDEA